MKDRADLLLSYYGSLQATIGAYAGSRLMQIAEISEPTDFNGPKPKSLQPTTIEQGSHRKTSALHDACDEANNAVKSVRTFVANAMLFSHEPSEAQLELMTAPSSFNVYKFYGSMHKDDGSSHPAEYEISKVELFTGPHTEGSPSIYEKAESYEIYAAHQESIVYRAHLLAIGGAVVRLAYAEEPSDNEVAFWDGIDDYTDIAPVVALSQDLDDLR